MTQWATYLVAQYTIKWWANDWGERALASQYLSILGELEWRQIY